MASLTKIEGVGSVSARKLAKTGIKTTGALLKHGATPKGRKQIAEKSGFAEKALLRCVNMCDLFRIKGVGEEYADLLEAAGVDTVPELAQRNVANLTAAMARVNTKKKLVRKLPSEKEVTKWVSQAKKLPRLVTY